MGTGGDAEAPQQKQHGKKKTGHRAKGETIECEGVGERADIVRGTEKQA